MKKIKKEVVFKCESNIVWKCLTELEDFKKWAYVFEDTTTFSGIFALNEEVRFFDSLGRGMVAKVIEFEINKKLVFQVVGELNNHELIKNSAFEGNLETYDLEFKDGLTKLIITQDMDESYFDEMSNMWDLGLKKMKEICEDN